jgi:lysozyme
MFRKLLVGTGTALGVGIAAWFGYSIGLWRFNYPGSRDFPVRGIDVSHHQGDIDWEAVSGSGLDFTYIKATEGAEFVDPRFSQNWSESRVNGMIRGAYHFFTLDTPGAQQALNFLNQVPIEACALPPAIDFEFAGNSRERLPREEVISGLFTMADTLEAHYGKKPLIYVTGASCRHYLAGHEVDCDLWVRRIVGRPSHRHAKDWLIWQFAGNTRVEGIRGPVDRNVFRGDSADLRALATVIMAGLTPMDLTTTFDTVTACYSVRADIEDMAPISRPGFIEMKGRVCGLYELIELGR